MVLVDVPDQYKVDYAGILAFCVIINEIGAFKISQPVDNPVNHLINSHNFTDHGIKFREEGMIFIRSIKDLAAVFL